MFIDSGLKDQTVIVTGGARGIGKSIVEIFAEEGAKVHFCYNKSNSLADDLLSKAADAGWKVHAYQTDISNPNACAALVESIYEKENRVDVLVNNSGIIRDQLLMGLEPEDIQAVFDTNINGTFYMTKACIPFMMRQRAGKIINISSVAGEKAGRGQANYAASKGAINAFTKAMAVELAPRNICVNAVAPGIIETDISKKVRELAADEATDKVLLKRFGQPEEVAHMVAFLASKYGNYINGQIIGVDGGFKMA